MSLAAACGPAVVIVVVFIVVAATGAVVEVEKDGSHAAATAVGSGGGGEAKAVASTEEEEAEGEDMVNAPSVERRKLLLLLLLPEPGAGATGVNDNGVVGVVGMDAAADVTVADVDIMRGEGSNLYSLLPKAALPFPLLLPPKIYIPSAELLALERAGADSSASRAPSDKVSLLLLL